MDRIFYISFSISCKLRSILQLGFIREEKTRTAVKLKHRYSQRLTNKRRYFQNKALDSNHSVGFPAAASERGGENHSGLHCFAH